MPEFRRFTLVRRAMVSRSVTKIRVRSARPEEAAALTALCLRSKAHWGYDAEFMRRSAVALTITPSMIKDGGVIVAEDQHLNLVGVAAVQAMDSERKFDLTRLFVEPAAIRAGIGRTLFDAVMRLVAINGGTCVSILADPFAAAFYERLGAVRIGEAPSDVIPGRLLPLLEYAIAGRRASRR
jgi:predicted N-acetyltransferase YhbS